MRTRVLLILAIAAAAVLAGGARAYAHSPSTFYYAPNRWAYGSDVNFALQVGYPSGQHRTAVSYAAAQWTGLGGAAHPDRYWSLPDSFGSFETPTRPGTRERAPCRAVSSTYAAC